MITASSSPLEQQPISIVIADDHWPILSAFCFAMRKQKEVHVAGTAVNGAALLELIKEKRPQVVLTDIKMPVMDGIAATKEIKKNFPLTQVIAYSGFDEEAMITDMFEAGVSGYLLKEALPKEIVAAIKSVNQGDVYCSPIISNKLVKLMKRTNYNPLKPFAKKILTEKELSVLKLKVEGYSSKEIAQILNVDIRSVESTMERIIVKAGCRSSSGMGLWAIRNNIIKS